MSAVKLVAFAGSSRAGSVNQGVLKAAVAAATEAGAEVEVVDLRALDLPLYDQELEEASGLPSGAADLKAKMKAADGFLIASPEYNSGVTPLLLNALTWVSRGKTEDEPMAAAFTGKVAGLVAGSPGGLGGLRGLFALRAWLQNVSTLVVPTMAACGGLYGEPFTAEGKLTNERSQGMVEAVAKQLVEVSGKLRN